jgi:hypothetical protein
MLFTRLRFLVMVGVVALVGVSCSSDGATDTEPDTPEVTTASDQESLPKTQAPAEEPADEPAEEPADEPADEPATAGDIAITLSIGDETWEFPAALCAYKNAPAGEAGSEWNVSHVNNGLQVYIADDEFGTLVSVADIEHGGSPTVSWEAIGDAVEITVSSNDVTASGTFTDGVNGGTAQGTLTATCPDWFDAT